MKKKGNAVYLVRYAVYLINKKEEMKKRKNLISRVVGFVKEHFEMIVLLIFCFVMYSLFGKKKQKIFSNDSKVSNAISVLNSCFNKVGTFDTHLEPIFQVLEGLTAQQIKLLHKDFGLVPYNSLWNKYIEIPYMHYNLSLSGVYYKEFDNEQINRVKEIYKSKGLDFPL